MAMFNDTMVTGFDVAFDRIRQFVSILGNCDSRQCTKGMCEGCKKTRLSCLSCGHNAPGFNPCDECEERMTCNNASGFILGEKDIGLALTLLKTGRNPTNFMFFIEASVNITAPIFWWEELQEMSVHMRITNSNLWRTAKELSPQENLYRACYLMPAGTEVTKHVVMNYYAISKIYFQCKDDAYVDEKWICLDGFCEWVEALPCFEFIEELAKRL